MDAPLMRRTVKMSVQTLLKNLQPIEDKRLKPNQKGLYFAPKEALTAGEEGYGKCFLDLSFQSKARWGAKQRKNFISSLASNRVIGAIVFVKVDEALAHIKEYIASGNEDGLFKPSDVEYFERVLSLGFSLIIVDGNNRLTTIMKLVNNVVHVPPGKMIIGDFTNYSYTIAAVPKNTYFKQLSPPIQQKILDTQLTIEEISCVSRNGIFTTFANVNDGVKLNATEFRNGKYSTLICSSVRDFATDHDVLGETLFGTHAWSRRGMDEWIAKSASQFAFGLDGNFRELGDGYLNQIYEDLDVLHDEVMLHFDQFKESFNKNMEHFYVHIDEEKLNAGKKASSLIGPSTKSSTFTPAVLFDFNILLRYLKDEGWTIRNIQSLINEYGVFITDLVSRSSKKYNDIVIEFMGDDGHEKTLKYVDCLSGTYKNLHINARLEYTMSELIWKTDTVFRKDPLRFADRAMTIRVWKNQEYKCSISGKQILFNELFDKTRWQVDHIIPWNEGGKTVPENLRVIAIKEHWKITGEYNKVRNKKVQELEVVA